MNTETASSSSSSHPLVVDHLEEDLVQIPSQRYALISIVSPQSNQKFETCALKIRGVFATEDEARRHATRMSSTDTTFDVYMVDMYKWLPIPPSIDLVEDRVYQDGRLNELIQGHKDQQILVKQHYEDRKHEMMNVKAPVSQSVIEEEVGETNQESDTTFM
jgi:hypothetical protein